MRTIKTKELKGAALDWAVAKCEGYSEWDGEYFVKDTDGYSGMYFIADYSTDWAQGGPIIEREGIALLPTWTAERPGFSADGPTPLIAAMRCYVASKLGDEITLPEELQP